MTVLFIATRIPYFYPRSPCGERHKPRYPWTPLSDISIHALLAESDLIALISWLVAGAISIHALLAESDVRIVSINVTYANFYPRSPCGERPHIHSTSPVHPGISIHALLAESDCSGKLSLSDIRTFLSTLSLRRATVFALPHYQLKSISIHALLAESDAITLIRAATQRIFLSTLSLRRATLLQCKC